MKSGIGPENVLFEPFSPNDVQESRFVAHYDRWVKTGRPSEGPLGLDRIPSPIDSNIPGFRHRDYLLQDSRYKLRPEVRLLLLIKCRETSLTITHRLLRRSLSCGKPPRIRYGGRGHGKSFKTWRNLSASKMHMLLCGKLMIPQLVLKIVCLGTYVPPGRALMSPLLTRCSSYVFAETFKYLYLTFIDPKDDPWPLDRFVFSTEAHPLPIFSWTTSEQRNWDAFRALSRHKLVM
jgi:mannosyl-oligosaccharide alpha-1,2-mannosidase